MKENILLINILDSRSEIAFNLLSSKRRLKVERRKKYFTFGENLEPKTFQKEKFKALKLLNLKIVGNTLRRKN